MLAQRRKCLPNINPPLTHQLKRPYSSRGATAGKIQTASTQPVQSGGFWWRMQSAASVLFLRDLYGKQREVLYFTGTCRIAVICVGIAGVGVTFAACYSLLSRIGLHSVACLRSLLPIIPARKKYDLWRSENQSPAPADWKLTSCRTRTAFLRIHNVKDNVVVSNFKTLMGQRPVKVFSHCFRIVSVWCLVLFWGDLLQ